MFWCSIDDSRQHLRIIYIWETVKGKKSDFFYSAELMKLLLKTKVLNNQSDQLIFWCQKEADDHRLKELKMSDWGRPDCRLVFKQAGRFDPSWKFEDLSVWIQRSKHHVSVSVSNVDRKKLLGMKHKPTLTAAWMHEVWWAASASAQLHQSQFGSSCFIFQKRKSSKLWTGGATGAPDLI